MLRQRRTRQILILPLARISGRIHLSSLGSYSDRCQTRSTKFLSGLIHKPAATTARPYSPRTLSWSISLALELVV